MKIQGIVTTTALILAIIAVSTTTAAALSCSDGDICVNQSGWWRDGGALNASTTPIQAAVDNAIAGETIFVWNGSYTENVDITKQLTLRGEGAGVVTVTAALTSDHVFNVTADYVNISGLTATGGGMAGIFLGSVQHCNISANNASGNGLGIWLNSSSNNALTENTANSNDVCGIALGYSSNNTLVNNNASTNGGDGYGIALGYSSNNTLVNNTANSNCGGDGCNQAGGHGHGIRLYWSSNNTLTNNTANSNTYSGISLDYSSSNTLLNNTASLNHGRDTSHDGYDGYGIRLYSSSNNTLTSNTASSNRGGDGDVYGGHGHGIYVSSSSNNTLLNNTASSNCGGGDDYGGGYGIALTDSSNNTLTSNTASSNDNYGIRLYDSSGNLVYNNYFNNTANACDDGNNQWNITKMAGTNIIGGLYLGGNYWGDYAGVDNDDDGLGDTGLPYNSSGNITNGGDYHPLVLVSSDTTSPVITITTPVPYELYIVGMTLDFSATDSESGVDTIVGNLTNTSGVPKIVDTDFAPEVGVYTLVVTATDNAGNTNVSDPVFFRLVAN